MRKWLEYSPETVEKIQELRLNQVVRAGNRKLAAYESPAVVWAKGATKEEPGNEIVVVVACTSYETYGPNANGDGFPAERAYPELGIPKSATLKHHYKSFEQGRVHWMHDMKKPVGKVLKAFWNEEYKWVELVIELYEAKLPKESMEKLRAGNIVFVSMGCEVSEDICSVCGNKSSKESDYCTHIKDGLLDVYEGVIAAMLNPNPKFDDISVVFIPADAVAATMYRKVASTCGGKKTKSKGSNISAEHLKKQSMLADALNKLATLYKDTGDLKGIKDYKELYSGLTKEMEDGVSKDSLSEVLAFFVNENLPLPLHTVCEKYGINLDKVVDAQKDIVANITDSEELFKHVQQAIKGETEHDKESVGVILDKAGRRSGTIEGTVAVFNIINKMRILQKPITEKLPKGSPIYDDVQDIVALEFLL